MKYFTSFIACLIITSATIAQQKQSLYLGAGFGLDYGGLGVKAEYQPEKHVGLFGGLGYNLASVGYNAGLIYNILPDNKVTPVLIAMYGYNAIIKVSRPGGEDHSVYNGLTVGAGIDIYMGRSRENKLNISLLAPFRDARFFTDYNYLSTNGQITQKIVPVAFSIGWSFAIIARDRDN